ncbi:hypothetical protein D0499_05315 [Weissella soli]|nr:hypothetical protein [Weissella soli]
MEDAMTPILYEKDEIEFTSHGLGDLTEIYDVDIHEQRNGLLQLTASYPVSGISYDEISVGRVILAKPNQRDDNHAFRIVRTELDISGYAITIEADSITYDLTHNLVKHLNVDSSDGQTFMNSLQNAIVNPSIFTFYSDVSTVSTTKLDYINPMEAIMGTTGSFLQFWGGELKRENRRVARFNRRGRDNVSTFRLGKNIAGLKYTVDIGSLVTRIIPTKTIQSDDQAITLEGTPVDSKYINSYEQIYTLIVDFTDDKIKTVADLNATAKNWFTASTNTGVDLPNITVDIDVLSLQDSSDYQDKFKNLESVSLTDTVTVYVPEYGVNVTAIVNELHYDPIQERVTKLTVGTAKQSFADSSRIQLSDLQNKIIDVKNQADSAVVNANGKNTNYYGSIKPSFPQEGDLWYWINGDQSGIKQFVNGDWVSLVDSDTEVKIAASVDAAVAQAQSMDAALNQSINDNINETMTTVNTSLAVLDSEAAVFKSEADSALQAASTSLAAYASLATASANKALSSAATAASSASAALSQVGVNSLATSSVASDVNGLKASYTSLNSSAGVLTSQTASLAVSASSASAQFDKVSSTTGSLATETAALKVSASSASAEFTKVNSSAGSLATQAASLAVSASSAALSIGNVQSSAGSLSAQTASLAVSASSFATTVSKQAASISSVTTRIQTAEGSISAAQNNITGLQSSQTQTANQLQTEITDRNTGDANTLTQAKSFTTSQIATYDTGIQSQFTQTSNSFIATLSAINQVVDSSLTNGLDMWRLVDRNNNASQSRFYKTSNVSIEGVASVGYNQSALSGDYTSISTQMMSKNGWQSSILNVSVDAQVRTLGGTDTDYFIIYLSEWDDSGTQIAVTSITGTITTAFSGTKNFRKTITLNANTTKVMLTYQMRGNGNVYISRPYVGANELPAGAYVEGPATNSVATLALMQNNYTFGINSNGVLVSGIMGNEKQVTLAGNAIHLDGNTTVSGDFYALGGNFKNLNASEIKTGTINASLINVININANNITTGKLNALLLTGNTGYLGTVNTGRVVNSQDNHLQLASYGFYDSTNDRAQVELLNNDSAISAEMRGSFNYYGNPTDKGNGLGIRMKYNQILAIDESGGSKNLYLSPYAGGQVRIVSRDLSTYYDIAAANFKVSSQRKFKENITSFPDGALDIVNNTTIRQYTKNGVDEIGVITDEAPKELISSTGEFVSIYDYVSILYKAVQELSAQVNELNRR